MKINLVSYISVVCVSINHADAAYRVAAGVSRAFCLHATVLVDDRRRRERSSAVRRQHGRVGRVVRMPRWVFRTGLCSVRRKHFQVERRQPLLRGMPTAHSVPPRLRVQRRMHMRRTGIRARRPALRALPGEYLQGVRRRRALCGVPAQLNSSRCREHTVPLHGRLRIAKWRL